MDIGGALPRPGPSLSLVLLSISLSLSLSSPDDLSLSSSSQPRQISYFPTSSCYTRRLTGFRRYRNPWGYLGGSPNTWWQYVYGTWRTSVLMAEHHPPAGFDDQTGCQLPLRDVTLCFRRKCSDRWHAFPCKNINFTSGSELNRALFWGNDLEFILVVKNDFQWYCKSHIFRDSLWHWQLKCASFCVHGQLRSRIRIWDHSQTLFDAMNQLVNELLFKIEFFEVRLLSQFTCNFEILIVKALFWKPSIPLDSYWRVGFNFKLKSLFWLTDKN